MSFITPGMATPDPKSAKPKRQRNYKVMVVNGATGESKPAARGLAVYEDQEMAQAYANMCNDSETGVQAMLERNNPESPDLNPDVVYIVEETFDYAPTDAQRLAGSSGITEKEAQAILDKLRSLVEGLTDTDTDPDAGPGAGYGEQL